MWSVQKFPRGVKIQGSQNTVIEFHFKRDIMSQISQGGGEIGKIISLQIRKLALRVTVTYVLD